MKRYEWIAVLEKAKELAADKSPFCFNMFAYLLEAMKTAPVHYYCCDEETTEEDDE